MIDGTKSLAFHWTLDRFTCDLLPPRAGFLIAHDEVLIVDTRKVEVKLPSVYRRLPHQTGVTERSISGDDGRASNRVLHQMMVSHLSNGICGSFAVAFNSHNNVIVADECSLVRFYISRVGKWIKHPFKMVLSREPG